MGKVVEVMMGTVVEVTVGKVVEVTVGKVADVPEKRVESYGRGPVACSGIRQESKTVATEAAGRFRGRDAAFGSVNLRSRTVQRARGEGSGVLAQASWGRRER